MKTATRIILASALALSAAGAAFAAEEDTLLERENPMSASGALAQHVLVKRVRAHHASETRTYAPAATPSGEVVDFSIGSQR